MSQERAAAAEATPAPDPTSPGLRRSIACIGASVLLWTIQGLGMNLVAVNTYEIQGALGATVAESSWLIAAYMAPNVSLTLLLTKIRTQFGLRHFAEISIVMFTVVSLLHLHFYDQQSLLLVRFLAGMAAAPVSTLGFLYMLDAFPPARKMTWGLSLALSCSAAMPSIARIISPPLLGIEQWHGLYMLEVGLALAALAVIYLLPLTPVPRAKVLHRLDFLSYPLIALGFGLLAVVLAMGRYYWWLEAPWIGMSLAVAVMALALAAVIELNRDQPLMNVAWLSSPEILHFTATLLLFRLVLAEQSSGAAGLFNALGMLNEQSRLLYLVILAASFAGGLVCALTLSNQRVPVLHAAALFCIAVGAYMDGHATHATLPGDMLISQALIAFGGALFLPPALLSGLTRTLKQGPTYITSFIVVFLFTQNLGGLAGSAVFGTFVTLREKFHSSVLVEQVRLTDPVVVQRLHDIAAAHQGTLIDSRLLNAESYALLAKAATLEANVLAYNDAFLLISAIAATALAALLLHIAWGKLRAGPAAVPAIG